MKDFALLVTDDYGNKFYEIHENGETIFDYTNNEVLKTNFFDGTYFQKSELSALSPFYEKILQTRD